MTPNQLASELRRIASKIEASRQPSASRVASELRRLVIRLAARTEVINQVNAAFAGVNAYPPNLVEIKKDTYEGEIDTGWVLTVIELPGGKLKFKLNGIPVPSAKDAALAYKKKDQKFLSGGPAHGAHNFSVVLGSRTFNGILKRFSIDANGVFKTSAEWSFVDDNGNTRTVSSDAQYESVPDYDSPHTLQTSYKLDGQEHGDFYSIADVDDTLLNEDGFDPTPVSDLAVHDFLQKNYPNEMSRINSFFQYDSMDPNEIEELRQMAPSGDGNFI